MRILILSEQCPYPLRDGGNLRTYHLLRSLAREHDVTLLTHDAGDHSRALSDRLGDGCRVVEAPRPSKSGRIVNNVLRFGTTTYPFFVLKNRTQRLLDEATRLLAQNDFDAVHFNHLDTACYALERRWQHKLVFDTHNCLSAMASQFGGRRVVGLRASLVAREVRLLERLEAAVAARVDRVLVCSEQDAAQFRAIQPEGDYRVIPNGVDTEYFAPAEDDGEEPGELVFTGAMGYRPNEEAALYFCREILPLLHARRCQARVTFVGRGPSAQVRALDDGTTIRVTGEVEDVRPYVHRAQVVIVPLRHGSGTRLKILEAFAMGKAVVSTPLGAEGIAAEPGIQIVLAKDAAAFADEIEKLLGDSAARRRIGRAAAELARDRFDWDAIGRELSAVYRDLQPSILTKCAR